MAGEEGGRGDVVQVELWSLSARLHLGSREEASSRAGAEGGMADKVGRVGSVWKTSEAMSPSWYLALQAMKIHGLLQSM